MIKPWMVVFALLALVVFAVAVTAVMKHHVYQKLYNALMKKDYPYFFEHVDDERSVAMIPEYTRESMRLTAYVERDETEKVTPQIEKMMAYPLQNDQKSGVLVMAYLYFYRKKNDGTCEKLFDELEKTTTKDQLTQYENFFTQTFKNYRRKYEVQSDAVPAHLG